MLIRQRDSRPAQSACPLHRFDDFDSTASLRRPRFDAAPASETGTDRAPPMPAAAQRAEHAPAACRPTPDAERLLKSPPPHLSSRR
ncbi:hypothetical protein EZV77_12745 [Burkholderia thailandensis]|uniref:Uncharacterized protein n=1 Tax=Burkholderia thailandensis TaxID=57975 RepID=A0AAW9D030_BURTH|nr:hypothetical protein AQ475_11020 [Burkholderia thailandensis]AVR26729.1 hypothetical protein A8H32_18235 [Burkholderia thailandensis]MDW9239154.1 hypothetical protein [Burkholderia thailandensis]MDW9255516.1 hypothetical protein [Burkholderia thailandensis]PJO70386.1 hypothetical protein CWD92_21210 [Burkholderia thailandensis]